MERERDRVRGEIERDGVRRGWRGRETEGGERLRETG